MSCPSCKAPIDIEHVPEIALELRKLNALRSQVQTKALKMIKKQGLDKVDLAEYDFYLTWPNSTNPNFIRLLDENGW